MIVGRWWATGRRYWSGQSSSEKDKAMVLGTDCADCGAIVRCAKCERVSSLVQHVVDT